MRVISQDGSIDLPYERVCLYIDSTIIIAKCDNTKYIMGSYSNKAEAVKHMEMCRKHYDDIFWEPTSELFQFPKDDEVKV